MIALLLALLVGNGATAQVRVEVRCVQKDCLTYGWEIANWTTGERREVQCIDGDCLTQGWIEIDHYGRPAVEVLCTAGSCFTEGFQGYSMLNPGRDQWLFESRCFSRSRDTESDCLQFGWQFRSRYGTSEAHCLEENCREKGWDLFTPQGPSRVRCKRNSCFEYGWDHW